MEGKPFWINVRMGFLKTFGNTKKTMGKIIPQGRVIRHRGTVPLKLFVAKKAIGRCNQKMEGGLGKTGETLGGEKGPWP